MKRSLPKSTVEQAAVIRMQSFRRGATNSLFLISCLVAVVAPPALHAILSSSDATRQAAMLKASQLSAIDRERVERNFARFQKMDDATQQHYVAMNQQIAQQPDLQDVLETYCSWVTTLTPGQRQDLLESTDRARKILLTQEFHKDQQQRESRRVGPPPLDNFSSLRRRSIPVRLSAADMKNVVERIRQKHNLPAPSTGDEPLALSNAKTILEFIKRTGNFTLLASRQDLTQGLIDLVSGPRQLTDRLRDLSDRHVLQCQLLWHAIFSTLFADVLDEIERKKPSEATLQQIFEKLSGEEQERLYRLSGREVRNWLTRRYFADATDPITQDLGKTLDELDDRRASFLPAPVDLFKGFRPPGMDGPGRRPEGGNPEGGRGRPLPPNDQNRPFRSSP